ncbi:hypothetical protein CQA49_01910 [Helicobacter sp. MIT 00-7814]|uniref:hypothetical protein n=1 Tax=unclassified Helicobacter TaxID=2593540 RepID=UPI000E1EF8C5|nr:MULTISPECIES: hypothetical protein [unclassified Helicobacter]RDU56161.1 hypothetical protein CQA37_02355 [Helicobacter sp. MIT 99-10781]RDU56258.1 hypothetical protein CQA49_01910 [Helicobacter sp. MIT 00-7814]
MSEYFEARGVSEETYENAVLAPYFEEIFQSLKPNARILDFGCGFGQTLQAIKNKSFAWNKQLGGGAIPL